MRISDTFQSALQNLGRRKVRTLLTSIGVFVGIITVVTMVSLGIGIQKQITDTIKSLGLETVFVQPKTQPQPSGAFNGFSRPQVDKPITADTVAQLKAMKGVESVEVILDLPAAPQMTLTVDGKTFPIALTVANPQQRLFSNTATMVAGSKLANT